MLCRAVTTGLTAESVAIEDLLHHLDMVLAGAYNNQTPF
jgi:hypothetical protein